MCITANSLNQVNHLARTPTNYAGPPTPPTGKRKVGSLPRDTLPTHTNLITCTQLALPY